MEKFHATKSELEKTTVELEEKQKQLHVKEIELNQAETLVHYHKQHANQLKEEGEKLIDTLQDTTGDIHLLQQKISKFI